MATFKAIVIEKAEAAQTVALKDFDEANLMDGDVTVRVEYSTLNYKDGLAITGKAPVVRRFPMIAGVDFAGTVRILASGLEAGRQGHPQWLGLGETHLGAYAEKARVKGDWLVRLPTTMSAREAMAIGTAGYTAMLAVMALERHGLTPDKRPDRRHRRGRRRRLGRDRAPCQAWLHVTASPAGRRRPITSKGSAPPRSSSARNSPGRPKPLAKERWAGGIDSVGSTTLANVLSMTRYGGAVAACGLAGGMDLPSSVAPFILRGVCSLRHRFGDVPRRTGVARPGNRLETDLDRQKLAAMTSEIGLAEVARGGARSSRARCAGESWSRSGKSVQDLATKFGHNGRQFGNRPVNVEWRESECRHVAWALIAAAFGGVPGAGRRDERRRSRHFVVGKLFSYNCFEGTRGAGRICRRLGRRHHPIPRRGPDALRDACRPAPCR